MPLLSVVKLSFAIGEGIWIFDYNNRKGIRMDKMVI